MTYNMRKAVGLDWRRDPGRVLNVINGLGADVVVLQEADRRLGARPSAIGRAMLEQHSDFVPADLSENDVSLGFHGNAILVRRGLDVTTSRRIPLPGLEPRGAVSVEIGGALRVVGVHLGLMRRHRQTQIGALTQALDASDVQIPTAIMGDFNEWSASEGLDGLAQDYTLHAPGRSFHAARPIATLDRVALSRGLELRDAGVEEGSLARIASDHLPVWVTVEVKALTHSPQPPAMLNRPEFTQNIH